ncbi:MAG: signal peptide peptidase SppA [Zetaproteobacteria bacterium]|nr:signal peptide peptidase SppA [Zetaproteobacteria bacterium]
MLKRLYGLFRGYLMVAGFFTTCIFMLFAWSLMGLMTSGGVEKVKQVEPITGEFILHAKLEGPVQTFWQDVDPISQLVVQQEKTVPTAWEMKQNLKRAAHDERVRGVMLELSDWSTDWSGMQLLIDGLLEFRESGKPLVIWSAAIDMKTLMLSSVATQIGLAPAGSVRLFGAVSQGIYYGKALKKMGIDFYVTRVGKYKSAFESLVANKPSAESVEALQFRVDAVNEYVWMRLQQNHPEWSMKNLKSWFARSLYAPNRALEIGMVSHLTQPEESLALLKQDAKSEVVVEFIKYAAEKMKTNSLNFLGDTKDGLAIIDVVGTIQLSGGVQGEANADSLREQLKWAGEQDKVKAVVLRINSPGGSALASDLIWSQVRALAELKPVIAVMEGVAASGGYYIASAAHKIVSSPLTLTGSIGVIGLVPSLDRLGEKWDVGFHSLGHTQRLGMLDPGKRMTQADKEVLQEQTDQAYHLFLDRIAEARGMPTDEIHKVAQGRVWLGLQAHQFGLVDDLGGWQQALSIAKAEGGLNPDQEYPLYRYGTPYDKLWHYLKSPQKMIPMLKSIFLQGVNPIGMGSELAEVFARWSKDPVQALYLEGQLDF